LKIQIIGQAGLPIHQYHLDFSRKGALTLQEKPLEKPKELRAPLEERERKASSEEADHLAIEELKKETKEGFLKKFFWPPSLWRGIRKSSSPAPPPIIAPEDRVPLEKGPGDKAEKSKE